MSFGKEEKRQIFNEKIVPSQVPGLSQNDLMNYYKDWAQDGYDEIVKAVDYTGPNMTSDFFTKHESRTDIRVLDVGGGTGMVAEVLRNEYDIKSVDGLDASQDMLDIAMEKSLYDQVYCCFIGDGATIPIKDDCYDGCVMSGAMLEGHVKCDAFLEMIRVVKPGGIIVNCMREENTRKVEEYTKLQDFMDRWESQGLWEKVEVTIPSAKYYMNYDALIHVYRVLDQKAK